MLMHRYNVTEDVKYLQEVHVGGGRQFGNYLTEYMKFGFLKESFRASIQWKCFGWIIKSKLYCTWYVIISITQRLLQILKGPLVLKLRKLRMWTNSMIATKTRLSNICSDMQKCVDVKFMCKKLLFMTATLYICLSRMIFSLKNRKSVGLVQFDKENNEIYEQWESMILRFLK